MQRAIFIDRDGTLIEEVGYLNHLSRCRLYPWSAESVRTINRAGWRAIVLTNQSGVARGFFPEKLVQQVHEQIRIELAQAGAHVDAFYYCPHHPTLGVPPYRLDCDCRKPKPGLLLRAAADWKLDLSRCWMVGDRSSDIETAARNRLKSAFVLSGYGRGEYEYGRARWTHPPHLIAENLLAAVVEILAREIVSNTAAS